jgi:hypothetical protein
LADATVNDLRYRPTLQKEEGHQERHPKKAADDDRCLIPSGKPVIMIVLRVGSLIYRVYSPLQRHKKQHGQYGKQVKWRRAGPQSPQTSSRNIPDVFHRGTPSPTRLTKALMVLLGAMAIHHGQVNAIAPNAVAMVL